jgi:hypothetical protein
MFCTIFSPLVVRSFGTIFSRSTGAPISRKSPAFGRICRRFVRPSRFSNVHLFCTIVANQAEKGHSISFLLSISATIRFRRRGPRNSPSERALGALLPGDVKLLLCQAGLPFRIADLGKVRCSRGCQRCQQQSSAAWTSLEGPKHFKSKQARLHSNTGCSIMPETRYGSPVIFPTSSLRTSTVPKKTKPGL